MDIVDSQVHIWGADTPQRPWPPGRAHEAQKPYPISKEALLFQMDLAGVRRIVLVPPSWEGDRNDLALEAARTYPDRFAVMGRLALQDPASRLFFGGVLQYNWGRKPPVLLALHPEASAAGGGSAMTFEELLDQAIDLLQRRRRLTYRTLKRQFGLDDAVLEDLKEELIYGQRLAVDEEERVLVWVGEPAASSPGSAGTTAPDPGQARAPLAYTPPHLAEKILTSRSALEGERKQVTVLFADLKGSMALLADRDPEEARQLLDPVLERMMAAMHRYEGTVNQVMGDGIMALFGAPLAHEDHAVRACYAALAMQAAVRIFYRQAFMLCCIEDTVVGRNHNG